MNHWRFIESPPADIFSQMALDRELFEEFVRTPGLAPLLRIYRVDTPAVTVGRFWSKKKASGAFKDEIPVCVRPTGGGLVRHGSDLIYSVLARRDSFPAFGMVRTSYLSFHEAIQDAFRALGFETRLFRCDEAKRRPSSGRGECFKEPAATDVLLEEQKVAGGGQWRRREGFLHQGSVQLTRGVAYEGLREALKEAWERKFRVEWSLPARSSTSF